LRGWWLRLAVSIGLGAVLLALVQRDAAAIPARITLGWPAIAAYAAWVIAFHGARAVRWHAFVAPLSASDGGGARVRWWVTSAVGLAGFTWMTLLPLRLGELARPLLLAQATGIPVARSLGSLALERVADGLVVAALFFTAVVGLPSTPELAPLRAAGVAIAAAFGGALVLLMAVARWPATLERLVHATLGRVVPRMANGVAAVARDVAAGLAALPSAVPLLQFAAATAGYWVLNIAGTWWLARALGLDVSAVEAAGILAVLSLALLIPGGPAFVGNFQLGVALGLGAFAPAEQVARVGAEFALWAYVVQLVVVVGAGALAHLGLRLQPRALWRPELWIAAPPRAEVPR
jgi:uncharacterized membrane protein YbhN (UPF0104 family)